MSSDAASIDPTASPGPNQTMPGLPGVAQASLPGLAQATTLVLQGLQVLAGQRGSTIGRAVTFRDLIRLQLITPAQAASLRGATTVGKNGTTTITSPALQAALDSLFGTVTGTTIYRGASEWDALSIGSSGDVLTTVSGAPSWQPPSGGGGGGGGAINTLDPNDCSANCTLTAGNLAIQSLGGSYEWARSNASLKLGSLAYFEVTVDLTGAPYDAFMVGVAPYSISGGGDSSIPGFMGYGQYHDIIGVGTTTLAASLGGSTTGDVLGILVDTKNNRISARRNGGSFVSTASLGTTVGGNFKTPMFAYIAPYQNVTLTVNFGATGFAHTLPTGAVSWNGASSL